MLPELGYFSLILAAVAAAFQVGCSLFSELFKRPHYLALNPLLTGVQSLFSLLSFALLRSILIANYLISLNLRQRGAGMKVPCCFGLPH